VSLAGRVGTFLALAVLLPLAGAGCQRGESETAKVVVVFMDVSASVRDFDIYRAGWPKIIERLQGGDRIVLARITDETFTRFRPVLDREIPAFNPFTDNKLQYEKRARQVRQEITEGLEKALTAPRSPRTDIMNSLVLAEKIFTADRRRRGVLVLLSDMLEDSEEYNFERLRITDEFTRRVIEDKRRRGQLPNLGGATVYVAGASGRTAGKAHEVQRFWLEYVKAANARLRPENYGPALVHFGE
jgi:hypothetical protein